MYKNARNFDTNFHSMRVTENQLCFVMYYMMFFAMKELEDTN